jgi:uncharacterized protein (TIRG00374 family)
MANHSAEPAIGISSKTIRKGISFFIFFTLIGTGIVIWWKTPYEFSVLIHKIDWFFIIGLVPLIALDYILGGFRYTIFFNSKILPHISFWNCIRANLANIFMGAATPFQTGGGAAQLYIFWRSGAKLSDSILISLINFCATLIFFLLASLVVLFILPSTLFLNQLVPLIQGSFIVVGSIISLILLILLFPSTGTAIIRFIINLIPFRLLKLEKLRDRLLNTFTEEIQKFHQNFTRIRRYNKGTLILTLIITSVLFFNKYVIGFIIARALRQVVPFGTFIGLQIINLFIIYFAPTPGASGIAELSSTWLMGKVMSSEILVYFALLWRFFVTFLGAFIGGFILLMDLNTGVKTPSMKRTVD